MKNYEQVISKKIELKEYNYCVYALIKKEKIIYIGQTSNIEQRINAHRNTKSFTHYSIVEENVKVDYIDELESEYILKFDPLLNQNLPPNNKYKGIEAMHKLLLIEKRDIKKIINKYNLQQYKYNVYDYKKILAIIKEERLKGNFLENKNVIKRFENKNKRKELLKKETPDEYMERYKIQMELESSKRTNS